MRYVALALLIVFFQPASPLPRQTVNKKTQNASAPDKEPENCQTPPDKSPPTIVVNNCSNHRGDAATGKNEASGQRPDPNKRSQPWSRADYLTLAYDILTYLLVIIAFGTGCAVAWQARETRRSVQAIRDSLPHQEKAANAALLNAQALVHTERPWLLLRLVPTGPDIDEVEFYESETPVGERTKHTTCTFHLMNYGRTPAIVTAQKWELKMGKTPDAPVDLEFFNTPTPITPYIFPQGVSQPQIAVLAQAVNSDMKAAFELGLNAIYICGFIRYKDSVPREIPVEEYETMFCYSYRESERGPDWTPYQARYNVAK